MTPASDRRPPDRLHAERCVLGSVIITNEVIHDVTKLLDVDLFDYPPHRWIYTAMRDLWSRGETSIDAVTLCEELGRRECLDTIGGAAYLTRLVESVPNAMWARHYAAIVRQR